MPFTRYTADDDGAYTFHDDDAGTSIRAAGPAAAQRARELDAATPMALAGLPPVPPRPEAALLAAGPAPVELGDMGDVAAGPPAGGRPKAQPTAADAAALAASGARVEAAVKGRPAARVAPPVMPVDLGDFGDAPAAPAAPPAAARPAPAAGAVAPPPPAPAAPAAPRTTTPDGRAVHFDTQASAAAVDTPMQLVESGQTTVTSGTTSASQSGFQRSLGPSAETERAVVDTRDKLAQLQAQTVNEQAKASQQIASEREKLADLEMTWQKEQALIEQKTQERLAPVNAMMEQTTADVREARVDPQRLWKERGTGAQILAGISVLLGGLAQGLGAKTNGALDAIESAVNRDIQLQMQAIEKKRADVGTLGAVAQTIRQQGFDARTQELGMKITGAEAIVHNIESIAAKADAAFPAVIDPATGKPKPGPVSLKAQTVLAEMQARVAEWRAEMSERVRGQISGQTTRQTQSQVSKMKIDRELVPGGGGDPNDDKEQIFYNGQHYRLGGFVRPSEAEKWRDKFVQLDVMKMNVRKLKELRKEVGQKFMEDARYSVIADQIAAARSQLQGMGVLGEKESQRYDKFLSNLRAGDDVLGQMDDFTDRIAGGILNQTKARPVSSATGGGGGGITVVGREGTKKDKK